MKHITFAGEHESRFEAINTMINDMKIYRRIGNKYPVVSKTEILANTCTCYFVQMWSLQEITDGFIIDGSLPYTLVHVEGISYRFELTPKDSLVIGEYTVVTGEKAKAIYSKVLDRDKKMKMTLIEKVDFLKEFSNIVPKVTIRQ